MKKKENAASKSRPARATHSSEWLEFPCVTYIQGKDKVQLVAFVANARSLWSIVQVNQKEENKEEGYQRSLAATRVKKIAAFIDAGNVIPNSVLISFDAGEVVANGTKLRLPKRPDVGWVIDGQHRLAGAFEAHTELEILAVGVLKLPVQEQINMFVTVNREQRGVPSSLYLELLKHLPGTKSDSEIAEARSTDVANELKTDEESPFFGRIVSTTSPKPGQLSTTNFVRKVAPMLKKNGRMHSFSDESRAGTLNNYYVALKNVFPKEYIRDDCLFFKTLGFGALMSVLPTVIDLTLGLTGKFRVVDVVQVLKKVDYFDFAKWREMGTGSGAESIAADEFRTEIESAMKVGSKAVGIQLT